MMDEEDSYFREEEEPRRESEELSMESSEQLCKELHADQQVESPPLFSEEPIESAKNDISICSPMASPLETTFME